MNAPARTHETSASSLTREAELLPPDPPAAVARWIAVLLLLIFFAALAAAVAVRVPETVRSPFVLISEKGADPIQAPLLGRVRALRVQEGEEVAAGAVMFELQSDEIRSWQTQLQTYREDLRALEERTNKLERAFESQLKIKEAEINQVEQELGFRLELARFSREYVERMKELETNQILSKVELLKSQLDLTEAEKNVNVTRKTQQQAALDRERMRADRERQRTDELAELNKVNVRLRALAGQLEHCEGDLWLVRAPYHAVVIALGQRTPGGVVQPGQPLCELTPVEGRPRARIFLNETTLSRAAPGQGLWLFFDAYPYQRYGTVRGKLDWISPAAVSTASGPHFMAFATLDRPTPTAGGRGLALRVGMRGEARIRVGRRALFEYAFEPLRGLGERLRD